MGSFALGSWVGPVSAEDLDDRQAVYLDVEGACPDGETVANELGALLERWELSESAEVAQQVVRVVDQGPSLEISALGDVREVSDPKYDCAERARVAAVFIALRLEPAVLPEQPTPSTESEPKQSASVPSPSHHLPIQVEMDAGALVERSIDGRLGWTVGPLVGVGLSKYGVLAYFSASIQTSSGVQAESIDLRFSRVPLDFGVGCSASQGAWSVAPVLSVALDYFRVRASDLEDAETRGRLDVGPRLSLRATGKVGPARLFGAARVAWFPRDYVVDVEPLGEVMRTPRLWFGASAGLTFDFSTR